jgi:hypothetical protein
LEPVANSSAVSDSYSSCCSKTDKYTSHEQKSSPAEKKYSEVKTEKCYNEQNFIFLSLCLSFFASKEMYQNIMLEPTVSM